MDPIFIFGTSGHAHDVADVAAANNFRPIFVAKDAAEIEDWASADEIVIEGDALRFPSAAFMIGIGNNVLRHKVAARFAKLVRFVTLIHPSTSFGRGQREVVAASVGTVVFAGVRMTNKIAIGNYCTFNVNSTISHDCEIADFVNVSPGANIAGNVRIGEGAWIGTGAAINEGAVGQKRSIGANAIIGAGAVVLADCDPYSTYVGVPARKVK